ncbi:HD domain-containing protein [Polluticoccus soli]|uniref:HD domain-containing protein n=1 Tax=Polluticoccus soli TaxID=3034150 RepID=UPI0023E108AF|nr:HD domain-containing protein [Flavipsychrobacter sp. JY13-12]
MQEILDKIIAYTDAAHHEQMRRYTPERYIVHPVRVMNTCRAYTADLTVLAAAILHDVLEDTPVTPVELLQFLNTVMTPAEAERTLALVVELTDVYVRDKYPGMSRRERKAKEQDRMSATSADAQTIKYADIMDNCAEIVNHDAHFAPMFLQECRQLLNRMNHGNQDLFHRAMAVVERGLAMVDDQGPQ